jgi:hypothetical protein
MRCWLICILLACSAPPLLSQSNLGSVEGKVVNSISGEPVKKAVVTVRNANGQFTFVTAADQFGKFQADSLQPDKYVATAQAEGYAATRTSEVATVSAGQKATLSVSLAPLGLVTGRVVDENGEPLDGVQMMLVRSSYINGVKSLQQMGGQQTDDRGQFRIFDVQPGRYYLMASPQNASLRQAMNAPADRTHSSIPEEGYALQVYPGASDPSQATPHELHPGEEWSGADFKLRRMPMYHVRGRLDATTPATQGRAPNVQAEAWDCDAAGAGNFFAGGIGGVRPDRSFDMALVPGAYCLVVREPPQGIALRKSITVKDSDVNGLSLTVPEKIGVKGTVAIEGTPPPNLPRLAVILQSTEGFQQQRVQVGADNTFELPAVFPGKHTISVQSGNRLYAKSITYGSRDVTNGVIPDLQSGAALSIVLGVDVAEIDGTVQANGLASGTPVMLATIPDDAHGARNDMYRLTQSSVDGSFRLANLTPGDYRIVAVEGQNFEDMQNRDLLRLLASGATVVTAHPGGHEQTALAPVSVTELARVKEKLQ